MVFLSGGFPRETAEKRLDLKSLKGWTKTEELRTRGPELVSLRPSINACLDRAVLHGKLGGNGGTEGAPRGRGPPLIKKSILVDLDL
jgi:hypothetical protein